MSSRELLLEIIDNRVRKLGEKIYTSIPASVIEYDKKAQEAKLRLDVELEDSENAPLIACKVKFSGDDDYVVCHAIKEGSQGMAMFSCRAIKDFLETGQTQSSPHQFTMNDAWFIPGVNSDDKAIENPPSNGVRLQSRKGERWAWLNDTGFEVNVPVRFREAVTMDKGFDAKDKATLDGENLTKVSHTHRFTNADGAPSMTEDAEE